MAGMGILTIGGGISISSTGVGIAPGMAVSGVGVAITTVGVAATGQGIGIIGNSFNSLSDHIQNFKDSGTSGNNNQISNEVKNINEQRKKHIIEGSKNSDHHWERLVENKNWNDIEKLIDKTMKEGIETPYKSSNSKVLNINGEKVQVIYKILEDGTRAISDAWILY